MKKGILFGLLFLFLVAGVSAVDGCYSKVSNEFCQGLSLPQCDFYSRGENSFCTYENEFCFSKTCVGLKEEACLNEFSCLWGEMNECEGNSDVCVGNNLRRYDCVNSIEVYYDEECQFGCRDGECLSLSDYSCSEVEGGVIRKGTDFSLKNSCANDNFLVKYSCDSLEVVSQYEYCAGGCVDSVCYKEFSSDVECLDMDGYTPFVNSFVKKGDSRFYDSCFNEEIVLEYECNGTDVQYYTYECEYGCLDGKCLNPEESKRFDWDRLRDVEVVNNFSKDYSDLQIKGVSFDRDLSKAKVERDLEVFVKPLISSVNILSDYSVSVELIANDGIFTTCEYRSSESEGCEIVIPYYDEYNLSVRVDKGQAVYEENEDNNVFMFELDYGCEYCSFESSEGAFIMVDEMNVNLIKKSFFEKVLDWFKGLF